MGIGSGPLRAGPPSSGPASERPGSASEGPQGGRDGRAEGRTYGRTDSPYSTVLRLLRFPPEPLPCSHNCYHYKILEQGKGTDDHLLPLGDWFFYHASLSLMGPTFPIPILIRFPLICSPFCRLLFSPLFPFGTHYSKFLSVPPFCRL